MREIPTNPYGLKGLSFTFEYLRTRTIPVRSECAAATFSLFRFSPSIVENAEPGNVIAREHGNDWMHALGGLRRHDTQVVLELMSSYAQEDGGVSFPAFYGCIRALVEVITRSNYNYHY